MTVTLPATAPSQVQVPLVDLAIQAARIADDVTQAMQTVIEQTAFVLGPQVTAFEAEYAAYCGVQRCVGVGNGTDAIELALRAVGITDGDEVIIPANTFVATAEAVVRAGGRVVLADCDEDFLIDPASVVDRLTARTRAVIGVDLYGQIAPFERLRDAVGPEVALVEDAAQSQGAYRHGRRSGSFGAAAATSFYPGKNLGAYGDAGAVTTDDDAAAATIRAIRNHGGERRYEHLLLGTNSRLDSIQAAVLSIKLRRLDAWNEERRVAAERYEDLLGDVDGIALPRTLVGNQHVFHLYVVRVPDRDRVLGELAVAGIGAGIHYPFPVHRLPAFTELTGRTSNPTAERLAGEILSLPIFPGITSRQQEWVAHVLRNAVSR